MSPSPQSFPSNSIARDKRVLRVLVRILQLVQSFFASDHLPNPVKSQIFQLLGGD